MNYPFSFKSLLFAAAFTSVAATQIQAQDTSSTTATMTTDANFSGTTVIFKSVNASDMEVLNAYGSSFGMGDVVRITVAPPQPKVATPAVLTQNTPAIQAQTKVAPVAKVNAVAPIKPAALANTAVKTPAIVATQPISKVTPVVKTPVAGVKIGADTAKAAAPKVVAKTIAQEKVVAPTVASTPKAAKSVTNSTSKSGSKHASAKKKKSNKGGLFQPRYKNKKHGKQRYSCPKF